MSRIFLMICYCVLSSFVIVVTASFAVGCGYINCLYEQNFFEQTYMSRIFLMICYCVFSSFVIVVYSIFCSWIPNFCVCVLSSNTSLHFSVCVLSSNHIIAVPLFNQHDHQLLFSGKRS